MRRCGWGWAAAWALPLLGCEAPRPTPPEDAKPTGPAAADASTVAAADASTAARTAAAPDARTAAVAAPCKVMSSEGGPSATADATRWLDLAGPTSFSVRTLATGRELRFEGPGRVRPCADDVALVALGAAVGLPGSGEAPGSEQWAAAACGALRWASGVHRLRGGRDECTVHTSVGVASLWLADDVLAEELALDAGAPRGDAGGRPATSRGGDAGPSPWVGVEARRALRLRGRFPLDSPSAVASALASCARAAGRVQQLASTMNDADAGRRGELAAESVEARGVARAACAVAAVRVALAGARPEDEARLDAARAGLRDGP